MHNLTTEEVNDHQFIICEPNRENININIIRCLYGKQTIEHLYEYGEQFCRKYKENRKFLLIMSNDGPEGTLEVQKYADNVIFNFLNNLFNENLLIIKRFFNYFSEWSWGWNAFNLFSIWFL